MESKRLTKIAAASWLMLGFAVVALVLLALLIPEVRLFTTTADRDERIQRIKATTDIVRLQSEGEMLATVSHGTGQTAHFLCYLSWFTLLGVVAGSVVTLVQVSRLRREYE